MSEPPQVNVLVETPSSRMISVRPNQGNSSLPATVPPTMSGNGWEILTVAPDLFDNLALSASVPVAKEVKLAAVAADEAIEKRTMIKSNMILVR